MNGRWNDLRTRHFRLAITTAVGTVLVGAVASTAAFAAPASVTIVTRDYYVSRIGTFRPAENPRLSAAIRAFGRPTHVQRKGHACQVSWRPLRLKILFENFGGAPAGQTTCTPTVGRAQSFVARGPRFRTTKGLRVGQSSSQIPERHPSAVFADGFWALVTAQFPFGSSDEESPVLSALTKDGRVSALAGYIGGAGE
jgi:hypothetical protein